MNQWVDSVLVMNVGVVVESPAFAMSLLTVVVFVHEGLLSSVSWERFCCVSLGGALKVVLVSAVEVLVLVVVDVVVALASRSAKSSIGL